MPASGHILKKITYDWDFNHVLNLQKNIHLENWQHVIYWAIYGKHSKRRMYKGLWSPPMTWSHFGMRWMCLNLANAFFFLFGWLCIICCPQLSHTVSLYDTPTHSSHIHILSHTHVWQMHIHNLHMYTKIPHVDTDTVEVEVEACLRSCWSEGQGKRSAEAGWDWDSGHEKGGIGQGQTAEMINPWRRIGE